MSLVELTDSAVHSRSETPALAAQTVLVTGGARGLGAAISRAFLGAGARVVVNYFNSAEAATGLVAEYPQQVLALRADVRDRDQVGEMFTAAEDHFGTAPTTVVNNALSEFSFNGDARPHAEDLSAAHLLAQFTGSVQAPVNVIQAALPGMRAAGAGRIINIGTNLFQHPVVPYHDYTATKAALLALTRTLAEDLGPGGIAVNMVSGGLLRTTDASSATPAEVFDGIAAGTPLREVTTPEQLADAVLFFAHPWSRGVTGQNLIVDGGLVKG
ncbi:MAG TPA: 3-oxoacyl-ACP reductase [Ruania sp.]|nr:3-oxoacyl-ACP reductase [Ruania sp.]